MTLYYAKPDESYEQHITAVYSVWEATINSLKPLINRLAEQYSFSAERLIQGSLMTVILHDIGKNIEPFQKMMEAKQKDIKFDFSQNYRHELASIPFVMLGWNMLQKKSHLSYCPLEVFAVAAHHRPINTDFTSFEREKDRQIPLIYEDGVHKALNIARLYFQKNGWDFSISYKEEFTKMKMIPLLMKLIENYLQQSIQNETIDRVRAIYSLLRGILHYADWHGSANVELVYSIKKTSSDVISIIEERCRLKKIIFKGLTEFQVKLAEQSGHVIAVAPTGSGKTEASLLWALKNSQEMCGAKILYLLPTMATANSIWIRLVDIFGEENVGLTHSSADLMFNQEIEEEVGVTNSRRNLLFDQCFIRPVTVGTVDQLLTTGFNMGKWVVKEINAANSVIILDEIHAYDGWTLGLIISSIRHFASMGARFLLMSATMPSNLIELFQKELPNAAIIKDTLLLNSKRSKYYSKNIFIEEDLENIHTAVQNGYKVLVVVNTVDKCQKLKTLFNDLKPVCYHSRFILRDRQRIEEQINIARFVIATQIVEVSLDIDFDWLFTECAPPDAIAQRAGRINRYRDQMRDSRVYIYRADEKSEKIYNPINDRELLLKSFSEFSAATSDISEQLLLNIIEDVYKNYPFEKREGFQDALDQYKLSQKNRLAILDNRKRDELEETRQSKYETISVVPSCFFHELQTVSLKERRLYEVKVPYWYYKKNHSKYHEDIQFCDLLYDPDLGAILQNDNRTLMY